MVKKNKLKYWNSGKSFKERNYERHCNVENEIAQHLIPFLQSKIDLLKCVVIVWIENHLIFIIYCSVKVPLNIKCFHISIWWQPNQWPKASYLETRKRTINRVIPSHPPCHEIPRVSRLDILKILAFTVLRCQHNSQRSLDWEIYTCQLLIATALFFCFLQRSFFFFIY